MIRGYFEEVKQLLFADNTTLLVNSTEKLYKSIERERERERERYMSIVIDKYIEKNIAI